jgi:parallel beta-helix repeat protein
LFDIIRFHSSIEVKASNGHLVHNLNTGLNYTSIQEAINAPETLDGHIIFAESGIYHEIININKSIKLIGQNRENTIIIGNKTNNTIVVSATNVTISKFTVKDGGEPNRVVLPTPIYGVYVEYSANNFNFTENVLESNYVALYVRSDFCYISNNLIYNNTFGLWLGSARNSTLRRNTFFNNWGDFLPPSDSLALKTLNLDTSNIVDGKPIYYLTYETNSTINSTNFPNVGLLILTFSHNVTIRSLPTSVLFVYVTNSSIQNMTIENDLGILIYMSSWNLVKKNWVQGCIVGISLQEGEKNTVIENTIEKCFYGIWLGSSVKNAFFHNNLIDNTYQVKDLLGWYNSWNNTLEGNYWSDYNGTDLNLDGLGDKPYEIGPSSGLFDYYPLMGMFHCFNTTMDHYVNVISNSTIEDLKYFKANSTIKIYVSNMTATQTYGFCRICIPYVIMDVNHISVIIDDGVTPVLHQNYTLFDNGTHRWIYFVYPHSTHEISIIPEFYLNNLLTLLILTTISIIFARKRLF